MKRYPANNLIRMYSHLILKNGTQTSVLTKFM